MYLIGAGPGDPGLITLRGRDCLGRADVVLYDYLATPELLAHAPARAERTCLGRHGAGKLWTQDEINQRMIAESVAGRTVARLKGGDPSVFGRLAEEIAALGAAGVPFEIVPGVTAGFAAAAYAGVTVTHRDHASCVALVAGREQAGKGDDGALDYTPLAAFPGTLVFYMGVTTAPRWSGELIRHGRSPDTPVVLVRRCTWPDQTTICTTLGELPYVLTAGRVRPPVVAVVGEVAVASQAAEWFTGRPLFGQTVLVTRPRHQSSGMAARLAELGAEVVCSPVIEIAPPSDWAAVDAALRSAGDFDWIVFSSRNGVDAVMSRMAELGLDARALGAARLAAIGPATVAALAEWRLKADLTPGEHRAEALAEALADGAGGKRFLLARASRGREVLGEQLAAAGGLVEQAVVYESRDIDTPDPQVMERLASGAIDWVTVTSSAIARGVVRLYGDALAGRRLAAISPLTAGVLQEAGRPAAAVAHEYTADGLIDSIVAASRG